MADAVVVPGGRYGPDTGMLLYAAAVAERRGTTIHRHHWSPDRPDPIDPAIEDWVCRDVAPIVDRCSGTPMLIGKSLGTNAAALAADRGLPAVWLTPLLTFGWIPDAIQRASAPCLLVGGTADALWDGDMARRISPYLLEVEGADHGLNVPGPVVDTIAVLGRVVAAIDEFFDMIGWPG